MADSLQLDNVCAGYGQAKVLEDISFTLKQGCSLALLGRNGMGKTTLLATLMGATQLHSGHIRWKNKNMAIMPSHLHAQAGLAWVSQERDIFPSLTLEENLTVAARPGHWNLSNVYTLFPRLQERRRHLGNQLSGGEQQMLAMGRALMLNPQLLLLDEPLEGLAPLLAQELLLTITALVSNSGLTVILAEQHAMQILPITQQALALDRGRIAHYGDSHRLVAQPQLLSHLLGAQQV